VGARWRYLAALLLTPALAGCGGIAVSADSEVPGRNLTIYSSLPLDGPEAPISRQMERGEKLALADAGGRVGRYHISFALLNDASPTSEQWEPGITANNAKLAAQDNDAIAYIGDLNSAATAISLPLTNGANILQVSPGSPYVGLTSSTDAGQDDPERFYPSGRMTFGRLIPGDTTEAATQGHVLRGLGVHKLYVITNEDPFDISLADLVVGDAERAGIAITGNDRVNLKGVTEASEVAGEAKKVAASGAQAVFFCGPAESGTTTLWRALYAGDPKLALLGCHDLLDPQFTEQIGPSARDTFITGPWLSPALYPASGREVMRRYRSFYHEEAEPYALYGYEAMSVTLDAIRAAGSHANNRQAVIDHFFATHDRDSVIGRYSIQANGDTTLGRYAVNRVAGGRAVFERSYEPIGGAG
jgi:branched-chain amino acid transport system substrate-binding protein